MRGKKETRGRPLSLDSFDKDLIGRTIVKLMTDNEYVTLRTLSHFLKKNRHLNIRKKQNFMTLRKKFRVYFFFKQNKFMQESYRRIKE